MTDFSELHAVHSRVADEIKANIKAINADTSMIQLKLSRKTETDETQKLWEEFKKYSSYSDLKDLYNRVMPTLQAYDKKMLEMSKDYD